MNKVFSEIDPGNENKRYEIKLVYDGLQIDEVASWIQAHPFLFRREHPTRQINNIYFDTTDLVLRHDHMQGVHSRFKLRYRWYQSTWVAKNGQLELKQKIGNLGKKEVFFIKNTLDLTVLTWNQIRERIRSELEPEWKALFDSTRPVMINNYMREYYIDALGKIRITLDTRQKTYHQGFRPKPNLNLDMPLRNTMVLEVKAHPSHYKEIADVLAEFPLYSSAHSKYLEGMEKRL